MLKLKPKPVYKAQPLTEPNTIPANEIPIALGVIRDATYSTAFEIVSNVVVERVSVRANKANGYKGDNLVGSIDLTEYCKAIELLTNSGYERSSHCIRRLIPNPYYPVVVQATHNKDYWNKLKTTKDLRWCYVEDELNHLGYLMRNNNVKSLALVELQQFLKEDVIWTSYKC